VSRANEWDGREVSLPSLQKTVTPRLVGPAVERFKRAMGVCLHEGCTQIAGHEGPHNGDSQP
jgi:hypothetical protein